MASETPTALNGWKFVFQGDRLHLKVDGEWAEPRLFAYNDTVHGRAEIARQWAEYDRRGRPFVSYQNPTGEALA